MRKKGLSLEEVSRITGEDIEFIKKIFNTRRMGTDAARSR